MYVHPAPCIYTCYATSVSINTTSITVAFGGQLELFRRRLVPRSLDSPWLELHNYEDDRPKSVMSTDVVKPLEGDLNEDDVVVEGPKSVISEFKQQPNSGRFYLD